MGKHLRRKLLVADIPAIHMMSHLQSFVSKDIGEVFSHTVRPYEILWKENNECWDNIEQRYHQAILAFF